MTIRAPRTDTLPPRAARVDRPELNELLDVATRRRICVVIGAAGWGKTTAVRSWAQGRRTAWVRSDDHGGDANLLFRNLVDAVQAHTSTPGPELSLPEGGKSEAAVSAVCDWLRGSLRDDVVLVIDDLQVLAPDTAAAGVVQALYRQAPERLHVVLMSRQEMPFSLARLRGQGLVAEINAAELAFDLAEVAELLQASVGNDPPHLATLVWERTGGWPAAVHAVVEMLRGVDVDERPGMVAHLTHPGERFRGYLVEEVIDAEPEWVRALLRRMAVFGEVRSTAGTALGIQDAANVLAELTRRGLVRRSSRESVGWSLVAPLMDYFGIEDALPTSDRDALHMVAAQECLGRGAHGEALRHLVAAGAHAACAALLAEHGTALVNSGHGNSVLAAASLPSPYLDDPRIQRVIGHARQVRGQWAAAMECFRRAGKDRDELEPALAWRVGVIALGQGDFGEVLALLERTRLAGEDSGAEARLLALAASAYRMTGDFAGLREVMARAVAAAGRCGEPRARAAVHQVQAMLSAAEADRRQADTHYSAALHSAEMGNDLLQVAWIRVGRAFDLLEVGPPRQVLDEAQVALQLAGRCESPYLTAQGLTTRGHAYLRLGMLEAAAADFSTAVELFQRIGSRFLAWPLCGLGDLHRIQGQLVRARAAYEEALALVEPCHEVIGLGSALIGLARIRAADDLAVARALADRAVALGEPLREVPAYLTRGWIALLEGDRQAATADAARARAAGRLRRDDPGLAEAITLTVLASDHPAAEAAVLGEAIDIWHETGCRIEESTARIVADWIKAPQPDTGAALAHETLLDRGVQPSQAAGPLAVLVRSMPKLSIRTLGVFQVIRDRMPLPKTAWQSKKARDLVRILVARRRPVPREQLMELLWPDADPAKSGNRLSVLLSMVRDVLQPVPAEFGPLATDGNAVWLDPSRVSVDVEQFLAQAEAALEADRHGQPDAMALLQAAEAAYTGDFLGDDPYQEWALPLVEEVRAVHIALLRALASRLREAGDIDATVRYTLRLLACDPYDEQAHLDLVAVLQGARRLGEARRHYRTYVRRMAEIGVSPRGSARQSPSGR
jgi:DNA-binding SARP family transcriptional activator/tetratricopeptide (TPR) repeat protein